MKNEKINTMDVHLTHNLSTRDNNPDRKKPSDPRDFFLSNFYNMAKIGAR